MMPLTPESLQIARLEEQFSAMRATLEKMEERMESMERQLAEARGGWRTLMALGGAAATLGAAVTWLMSHVRLQ
jgi:phage shock protein A